MKKILPLCCALLLPLPIAIAQNFNFQPPLTGRSSDAIAVSADAIYSAERGYGFEAGAKLRPAGEGAQSYLTSDEPFYFSVALPEGNYRVRVSLPMTPDKNATTIKAELRRLMLENVSSASNETAYEFIVNLRRSQIAGGGEVRLKPRERAEEAWAWDDKLTLEFNGANPSVRSIQITPAADLPTVFLLGDSTVADQPREPYASWGQMLTRFFGATVAIANHAESGESLASAISERRLDKVVSLVRSGDWVFVQFGHNDMKKDDVATYTANIRKFTAALRARNASVVLVTQMHRKSFGPDGKIINTHENYPDAVRHVAREENLPLIDLHAMSQVFYEALGAEKASLAFRQGDATHHNAYGAYELAKCVIEGVRENVPALSKHIIAGLPRFDPARPDPVETFSIPLSPTVMAAKPDGS